MVVETLDCTVARAESCTGKASHVSQMALMTLYIQQQQLDESFDGSLVVLYVLNSINFILLCISLSAAAKLSKVEALKKRADKRPDWNDLMKEISQYRYSHSKLKKTVTNDRSSPIIKAVKVNDKVRQAF